MNLISHFLTGILCQIFAWLVIANSPVAAAVGGIFAFLSHFLVDAVFERFTYHPKPWLEESKSRFCHTIVYIEIPVALFIAVLYSQYWVGILCSILVDIYDWVLLRGVLKKDFHKDKKLFIHPVNDWFQAKFMGKTPNLNEKRIGYLVEWVYIGLLWVVVEVAA
jgi:membrane-bound metal-dependent hydrolase YbcI (DUF457 family)